MSAILPIINDTNRPFWDGCRAGVLRLQRCQRCGQLRYPVSPICPECMGTGAAWEDMSGRGEIFSFTIFRHVYNDAWRDRVPYAVALVRLEEGPIVISNIVGVDPDAVRVGLPVTVVFDAVSDEVAIPMFEPTEARRDV